MAQNGLPTLHVDPNLLARELDTSLSLANRSPTGPDDEALLRDASKRLGIPLDTARTNPQGTKQALQDSAVDLNDYARRFPSTTRHLIDPDNAMISRDDLAPLSEVEQSLRTAIRQSMLADVGVGVNAGQAIVEKFSPGYSAEVAREREVLRTEGFAAAAKLRRANQDRREAELARNTGRISEIEQPEPTIGNILSGLGVGTASAFRSQRLGLAQQLGDLVTDPETPEGEARTARYNRAREQQDFRASLARPEFDTWLADATYGGFESLAQTAPALALSIGTGTAAPGLLIMGAQSYGEAYGRYRGRGAARGAASLGAGGEASVEVLTELLPMKFVVDRFGKAGMTDFLKGMLGREVPGEQIATFVQDAIDTAIANPDKTWGDYWAERPEAAARTLVATLVQSGTVAAVGEGAGRLAGTLDRKQDEIDEARSTAEQLQQILAAAGRSMTRQRDPASFAQLVQQAAEDGGAAPTELFIDARTLVEALEQSGMSREQLEQALPSVAEQLEVAVALETDLVVPIGEATAALAGTDLETILAQNARTREDGMSMAEADVLDGELLQQLELEAAKVFSEQSDQLAWEDSAKEVFDTLNTELGNAGRFAPDVNRAYASLLRNFYATTASRLGTTPSELYARFPLRVSSRAPGQQAQVLDQFDQEGRLQTDTPAFRNWFGESKVVDAEGNPLVMYHGTVVDITEFSRSSGSTFSYGSSTDSGGIFFATDPTDASYYTTGSRGIEPGGNIIPAYLTVQNPVYLNEPMSLQEQAELLKKAEADGHDGALIHGDQWVVFRPEQIKSAIGNRGTFDPADPNILNQAPLEQQAASLSEEIAAAGGQVQDTLSVDQLISSDRVPTLTLQDLVGMQIFPTIADRTAAAALYTGVDSSQLEVAIPLLGGPLFPLRESNADAGVVWANRGSSVTGQKAAKLKAGANHMMVVMGDANMHQSNTTVSNAFFATLEAYVRDKRITKKNAAALTKTVRQSKSADPRVAAYMAEFPGLDDAGKLDAYLQRISFDARRRLLDLLGNKGAQALGAPSMPKILDATREPSLAGQRWGDGVLVVEVDQETPMVSLGEEGTQPHPDFPLGIRGKVVGKLEAPVNYELLWQDWLADARQGAIDRGTAPEKVNVRRAFELGKPVVEITEDLVARIGSIKQSNIDGPRQARLAADFAAGNWKTSDLPVKQGGVSPQEFADAIQNSEANATLTPYSASDLKAGIKSGAMKLYQLGQDGQIFFMLERKPDGRVELASVVNNEQGARGIGAPAVLLKALQEGATDLTAFAVANEKYPNGFLPALYESFGFEVRETLAFDPKYFRDDLPKKERDRVLADAVKYWTDSTPGFDPTTGMPSVVEMTWRGNDADRTNITERYLRDGLEGLLGGGVNANVAGFAALAWPSAGETNEAGEGAPDTSRAARDQGTGDRAPVASRAQRVVSGIADLNNNELQNLGLTAADRTAVQRALGRQGVSSEQNARATGDRGAGRPAGRDLAPLAGAPSVQGFNGPDPRLVAVAEQYAASIGIELKRQAEYADVDPQRAARIAEAYEAMAHAPQDPAVREAYENLIQQTLAQYQALTEAGYQFWFMDMGREDNQQYASSPWNAMRDIRANQAMGVFPTADGFGSSDLDVNDNPLLADTGLQWPVGAPDGPLAPVLANDLFRAVHDAFGHGLEGAGFRARGEENAWQAHVRLFTGSAVGAITSETRGQNSWLNYGPHGESNRTAPVEDTVFADQKTGLMPEWTWTEGRVADANPDVLNQGAAARASFNPAALEISLLEKADLSSFLHETGHFFFEMSATLAAEPGAPQELRDDMQVLLDHTGYEGTIEDWVKLSVNERREAHETIAESFEQYLFTGKAPTVEMQPLFRRFKSWMVSVYRSLQDFLAGNERASLTPEVSGVFDRLIATEEEIKAAQAVREFQPLFEDQDGSGMTPEDWEAYQANIEQHQAEALEELQGRSLRDMKWLDNARGRKLRELQRDAAARRKAMRDEITAEIEAEPVYAAMEFLKHGRMQADNEEIQIAENKAHKLNIDAVAALFPEGELGDSTAWKKLGYGKYGMLSNEGLPPDVVAEMFGFKSGRDLVTSILNAEPKAQAINGLTDQRMLERYGDLSSPAAMREAANEALANEARARMVATELKAVARLTGSPSALARAARQAAEEIVAARKVRNLRPDLAAAAAQRARKAAEKAMAAGDTAGAAAAKRTEILNVQLERAERNARAEHDKALRGFQKINKGTNERLAKSRDVDLVNAARAVLARYGLAPRGAAVNAQNYMEMLQTYDGSLSEDLRSMLQGLPPTMDFRDMSVEQFNGMRDIVNGLYFLSKRSKQMEIDGQKVELDAVADEIVGGILERTGGELPPLPGYTNTTTRADEWKVGLLGAKASLMRVEAWADAMGAPFKKYIWQPVSEAITRTKVKRNEMIKQYLDLLKAIEKGLTYDKINAPELGSAGFTFNAGKTELLHAVLHAGNQSNLKKLLLGRGWGTLREDGSLDTSRWDAFMARMFAEGTITQADMDFTQGVWDLLETIKVDAQAAHKEMYGYYFSEITADPVQTPWGEYRGGYVPAIADTLSSPDAAQKREQEELLHAGNSFMFPTTGKGFTQSRVEYNRPLALDLRAIGMHIDKVARFAYIEPAVRDVGRLLMNRRVARAMNGYDQGLISSMLNPWLQRSARQSVNSPGKNPKVDKFFNELRGRAGMVLMFGNVVNTMQQITGFSLAATKVPAHRLLRANARYITNHFEVVENARTLSPWLADRMDNHSFEMMGQIDKILLDPNPVKRSAEYLRRNAYFMQQGVQNVMDIIVWTGAYDHAVAKGSSSKDAVRYADETVRLTQGSFAPEDVSAFEVQSPFVRLFTQFYGYFNMWGNLLGAEGSKALRDAGFVKASPRLLFLWFVGMAIPAFVAELIAAGAPDEEDDEDGDGLLDEWLAMFFGAQAKSVAAMVPVAGQVSVLASNYMDDKVYNDRLNISPAVSLIESAVYGGTSLVSGEMFDGDPSKKELRSALILTGMALGVPVGPLMRAGSFAIDEAEGRKEADGPVEYGTGLLLGR